MQQEHYVYIIDLVFGLTIGKKVGPKKGDD